MTEARVGRAALILGYAGLLPQMMATAAIAATRWLPGAPDDPGAPIAVAVTYPLVILSFLGGIWWGLAMRRDSGQGRLAALAVVPSLAAMALAGLLTVLLYGWGLVAIGCAVMLTLPIDRHLVTTGDAPEGWMKLRVPLSLGLGTLTILAGAMIGSPVVRY